MKKSLLILLSGLLLWGNRLNREEIFPYSKKSIKLNLLEKLISKKENIKIDIDKIIKIESHGNPLAYNYYSKARGLMQITPIMLKEWNQVNYTKMHTEKDLFNPEINKEIGIWYLNRIKDYYLPKFGIKNNVENILIAYNLGIGNLRKINTEKNFDLLPLETKNYIKKYMEKNKN